tara:strand:- start:170 stop:607 length:438 start_codon:yes stop_codon:yes gene_type:complete
MKNILFLLFYLFISCTGNNQEVKAGLVKNPASAKADYNTSMPEIYIDNEVFDFGEIIQGESVTHDFIIKNVGQEDLIINSAKGSCGCTVPNWPKEAISPGKENLLTVTFNSAGKLGKQKKTVTLVTNAIPNTKVLTITGTILNSK